MQPSPLTTNILGHHNLHLISPDKTINVTVEHVSSYMPPQAIDTLTVVDQNSYYLTIKCALEAPLTFHQVLNLSQQNVFSAMWESEPAYYTIEPIHLGKDKEHLEKVLRTYDKHVGIDEKLKGDIAEKFKLRKRCLHGTPLLEDLKKHPHLLKVIMLCFKQVEPKFPKPIQLKIIRTIYQESFTFQELGKRLNLVKEDIKPKKRRGCCQIF